MGQVQSGPGIQEDVSATPQGTSQRAAARNHHHPHHHHHHHLALRASGDKAISKTRTQGRRKPGPLPLPLPLPKDHNEHVRKLSIVSNRNIQLLSMKPRIERDNYADGLRSRRRSSLINMILGAPSSGPRFSDDLCSLSSHMSDLCQNFGIDYFPDAHVGLHQNASTNSNASSLMRLDDGQCFASSCYHTKSVPPIEQHVTGKGGRDSLSGNFMGHRRRRSSLGSLAASLKAPDILLAHRNDEPVASQATKAVVPSTDVASNNADETHQSAAEITENQSGRTELRQSFRARPNLTSIFLASIDLTSSLDEPDGDQQQQQRLQYTGAEGANNSMSSKRAVPLVRSSQTEPDSACGSKASSGDFQTNNNAPDDVQGMGLTAQLTTGGVAPKEHTNQVSARRMLHRSGSELSLYSSVSANSSSVSHHQIFHHTHHQHALQQHSLPVSSSSPSMFHSCRASRLSSGSSFTVDGCCGVSGHRRLKKMPSLLNKDDEQASALLRETKLIIMLQVCLPFILAGFGNMGAGLVLNKVAQWKSFQHVPIFFVLLPSFVGLKGNIEMTLASRLSTLANLNLLTTSHQRRHAYFSNLILILSQAIGLSMFASFASMLCEFSMGTLNMSFSETLHLTSLVVLPCALATSMVLVFISSIVMWWSIWLANWIQVNPDNLSTLLAAMYGDVSCVLTYGLFAELMYSFRQQNVLIWPIVIICTAVTSWPILWYIAFKFKETHELSLSSMPPMLTGILVSLGSGSVLSLVVGRFSRIALYQPVVNGFGANLIAVQASRVSTWLWCSALRRVSSTNSHLTADTVDQESTTREHPTKLGNGSLVSFTEPPPSKQTIAGGGGHGAHDAKSQDFAPLYRQILSRLSRVGGLSLRVVRTLLWSFLNESPNSVAARLLLIMLIPAHTLYFFVIWLSSPSNYVVITWPFYTVYIVLCLTQVFMLLLICEPLMTFLMRRHLDPDIFGISLLMALADLVGTLCLTGAFCLLARLGDPNAF